MPEGDPVEVLEVTAPCWIASILLVALALCHTPCRFEVWMLARRSLCCKLRGSMVQRKGAGVYTGMRVRCRCACLAQGQ